MKAQRLFPVVLAAVVLVATSCSTNPKHVSPADFQRHFEFRDLQTMHAYSYLGETNGLVYMLYQRAPLVGAKWKKQILFTETNGLAPGLLEHMRSVSLGTGHRATENGRKRKIDDLTWLVGRWECVRQELRPEFQKPAWFQHPRDPFRYFVVYYPYADTNLTLEVTDNPDDRPIAAELLVKWNGPPRREELTPFYYPYTKIRIGLDRIWQGSRFELMELKYRVLPGSAPLRLILESPAWRYTLEKVSDQPGNINNSWVVAPLKSYSAEALQALSQRYEQLRRQH